jgi:hypothetical protein
VVCTDCGYQEIEPHSPFQHYCWRCGTKGGSSYNAEWIEQLPITPRYILIYHDGYLAEAEWIERVNWIKAAVAALEKVSHEQAT